MMEDFEAGGPRPPLEECLRRVREDADLLVVIVAARYGWVPSADWPLLPEERQGKSITWLECLEASRKGIQIVPLLLEEGCEWPDEYTEKQRTRELGEFKAWLRKHYVFKNFTSIGSFEKEFTRALDGWKNGGAENASDPTRYLEWLREYASRTVAMAGRRPSLDDIYVPLSAGQRGKPKPLDTFLNSPRLLVTGGPGSGKSTFLLKHACDLANGRLEARKVRFPIFVSAGDLS